MNAHEAFRRVAILGAGLIGASFGAAIEDVHPGASIVAFDRPAILEKLRCSNFQWDRTPDLGDAVRHAELVYIALPGVAAAEVLGEVSSHCMTNALVTDATSTKAVICKTAQALFRHGAIFVGGHPIAGKELAGFEHATAELFRGKRYVLVSDNEQTKEDSRVRCFVDLLRSIGAEPVWIEADAHDRAMAALSQMPQLVAIALAEVISREAHENGARLSLSGSGLQDMLRIAGSPYEIWHDICVTNGDNIARSLDQIVRAIDSIRQNLTNSELKAKFDGANELYKELQALTMPSDENVTDPCTASRKVSVNG